MRKPKAFFFSQYQKYNIFLLNLKIFAPVRLKDENNGFSIFARRGLNRLNVQLP